MRRMYCYCLAVAAGCSVMGAISAQAADMTASPAAPSYYKAPPAAQAFDWNGFYLGLNGGYAGGRSSWSDPAVGGDSGKFSGNGGTIGGQLGYNWQLGNTVLGVETDMNWLNAKGSSAGPGGVCASDGGGLCQTQQSWLGTTRLRAGYAIENWLPYLTGGLAYGNVRALQPNGTSSGVQSGWTAGAGLEYGFSRNWSAKLEYLHIDLGTATFMGAASGTSTLSVPVTDNLVRAGINYHW